MERTDGRDVDRMRDDVRAATKKKLVLRDILLRSST
jgi:hypothetical protein